MLTLLLLCLAAIAFSLASGAGNWRKCVPKLQIPYTLAGLFHSLEKK
ncbi:MAG: hypothetical protein N2235_03225 [Fischerella sp.]|nr:hypothetical protein [Fischerella sp.]